MYVKVKYFGVIIYIMIKSYIRKIIIDILKEPAIKPEFSELKAITFKNKDGATVYDIIENNVYDNIEFSIEYVDPSTGAKQKNVCKGDLIEIRKYLREILNNEPAFPHFKECTLLVRYSHEFGPQTKFDFIADARSKAFKSENIKSIAQTLISWIDARPELLI